MEQNPLKKTNRPHSTILSGDVFTKTDRVFLNKTITMKKLTFFLICALGMFFSQSVLAQSVTISNATLATINNSNIVYVSGTLTGVKGIPTTGYSVEFIYGPDAKTVPIVINAPSSGGQYQFAGVVPAGITISAPYSVKVTTNRKASNTATPNTYSCN